MRSSSEVLCWTARACDPLSVDVDFREVLLDVVSYTTSDWVGGRETGELKSISVSTTTFSLVSLFGCIKGWLSFSVLAERREKELKLISNRRRHGGNCFDDTIVCNRQAETRKRIVGKLSDMCGNTC